MIERVKAGVRAWVREGAVVEEVGRDLFEKGNIGKTVVTYERKKCVRQEVSLEKPIHPLSGVDLFRVSMNIT